MTTSSQEEDTDFITSPVSSQSKTSLSASTPLHLNRLRFQSFGQEWMEIQKTAEEELPAFISDLPNSSNAAQSLQDLNLKIYEICSAHFPEVKGNGKGKKILSREESILEQEKKECRLVLKELRRDLRTNGHSYQNTLEWKEARKRMKRTFHMYERIKQKNNFKKIQSEFQNNPFEAIKNELKKDDPPGDPVK